MSSSIPASLDLDARPSAVESHGIDGLQPWSSQSNGPAHELDHFSKHESGSESGPKRSSTAPTSSTAMGDRQTSGSVNRSQTAFISRPNEKALRPSVTEEKDEVPDLPGFPESIQLHRFPPSRQRTFNSIRSGPFEETESWDQKSILSLDGGGIRGYSTLLIIQELMRAIGLEEQAYGPRKEGEYCGRAESSLYPVIPLKNHARAANPRITPSSPWLPCHYFDYMAGTSTGGLISIMLGRLRMNVDDCIAEYENLGNKIFANPRWFHVRTPLFLPREKYDHRELAAVIEKVVNDRVPKIDKFPGGKTFASNEDRCRVAVISYQEHHAEEHQKPYLFRTYKNIRPGCDDKDRRAARNPGPAHDIPIWQVARATSAAPAYFKEMLIDNLQYIDGGFGTNNPCEEIIREVRRMNNNSNHCIRCVISIGTGLKNQQRNTTYSKLKMRLTANMAKFLKYVRFTAFLATQSESTHHSVNNLQSDLKNCFDYYRFNVDRGLGDMKLDEWQARNPLKVRLGKLIRRRRAKSTPDNVPLPDMNGHAADDRSVADGDESSGSATATQRNNGIPRCLQYRNKTLDKIREHTRTYLSSVEMQKKIHTCAVELVASRRRRIEADEQRWRKACYGTWYQCRFSDCPRGETEYHERDRMQAHLRNKHAEQFLGDPVQSDRLVDEKMAEFEVVME